MSVQRRIIPPRLVFLTGRIRMELSASGRNSFHWHYIKRFKVRSLECRRSSRGLVFVNSNPIVLLNGTNNSKLHYLEINIANVPSKWTGMSTYKLLFWPKIDGENREKLSGINECNKKKKRTTWFCCLLFS